MSNVRSGEIAPRQEEILSVLREGGLRCTPQRYGLLEFLIRRHAHATADEIHAAMNRSRRRMSRASVYNNLRALARAGLVREVPLEGKAARFDLNMKRHHHFVCERCGMVEDIDWFEIPRLAGRTGLGPRVIRNYEVVFRGACKQCS